MRWGDNDDKSRVEQKQFKTNENDELEDIDLPFVSIVGRTTKIEK